jgi:hypothetical protein
MVTVEPLPRGFPAEGFAEAVARLIVLRRGLFACPGPGCGLVMAVSLLASVFKLDKKGFNLRRVSPFWWSCWRC